MIKHPGANTHDLTNYLHQELRSERVEKSLHFDLSQGDDDDVGMTQTTSSGVQAEAQTSSSGVQVRPKTSSSGTQSSTTRMEESETQTSTTRTE